MRTRAQERRQEPELIGDVIERCLARWGVKPVDVPDPAPRQARLDLRVSRRRHDSEGGEPWRG